MTAVTSGMGGVLQRSWSSAAAILALILLLLAGLAGTTAIASTGAFASAAGAATTPATPQYDDAPNLAPVAVVDAGRSNAVEEPGVDAAGPSVALSAGLLAPKGALDDAAAAFCSFTGTTAVLMADGTTKTLAEVEVGDWVLAEDPETGERGARQVSKVWVHQDTVVDLDFDGGLVTTTDDHPFWNATDGAWQHARDLDAGDLVLTADGTFLGVGGLVEGSTKQATAYNLTVDGIHTYFVSVGDHEVLVHNTGCDEFAEALQRQIGGDIRTFTPPRDARVFPDDAYGLGPGEAWFHHTVVVREGRVYDQFTGSGGMPIDQWKAQWGDLADAIDFGF